jgi:hypothetical protein
MRVCMEIRIGKVNKEIKIMEGNGMVKNKK